MRIYTKTCSRIYGLYQLSKSLYKILEIGCVVKGWWGLVDSGLGGKSQNGGVSA